MQTESGSEALLPTPETGLKAGAEAGLKASPQASPEAGVALSLRGKVALITGGSRGIGAATVRLFRRSGARVVFSYVSSREMAEALMAECGGAEACVAVQQELATPEQGRQLVAAAVRTFGRVDCLIANHGIWPAHDAPVSEMSDAQWHRTIAVNLDSVFGLVQAAVAQMERQAAQSETQAAQTEAQAAKAEAQATRMEATPAQAKRPSGHAGRKPDAEQTHGHIVLISSTAGQRGEAFHADYAASKGAMISLTKGLSTELAPKGIRVNCVAPGWVATEMSAATLARPEAAEQVFSKIPLGRAGHVDEIAGPVLFLCTPYAGFITGEVFNVNGGAVLVG